VDFQKGCYLGQEVISRIKSVGRVKRQLSLIFADAFISQEATMRNEELGEGVATRDSKEISEGKKPLDGMVFKPDSGRSTHCFSAG
jgi:folate-binding Fe-S cluster repair protein YgfZ